MQSTLLEEHRWEHGESEWEDTDLIVIDTRRRGETNSANCCVCVLRRPLPIMRRMTLVGPRIAGSLLSYRQIQSGILELLLDIVDQQDIGGDL